jgi:hypothetical protein
LAAPLVLLVKRFGAGSHCEGDGDMAEKRRLLTGCGWRYGVAEAVVAGLTIAIACPIAEAIDMGRTLRKIARVADDVPISKLDDAATEVASSRFARELVEKAGARVDDVADRARVIRKLFTDAADGLPPAVLKEVDALEGPAQETLAVLARGSKKIGAAIPDVAERSRLITEGGAGTLLVVGPCLLRRTPVSESSPRHRTEIYRSVTSTNSSSSRETVPKTSGTSR